MKKSFRKTLLLAVMCYSCTLIWSERVQKVGQRLKFFFFLSFYVGPDTVINYIIINASDIIDIRTSCSQ